MNAYGNVTLDGFGNGTVRLGPPPNVDWQLGVVAVSITPLSVPSETSPQCSIYIGPNTNPENLIDGTYVGEMDSTSRTSGRLVTRGNYLFAVWSKGSLSPGHIATVTVAGVAIS